MTICPICSNPMHGSVCTMCAYDLSCDIETYGSLSGIRPGRVTMSVISIRTQWQNENSDLIRCPTCKGTLFGYHKDTAIFRCRNCGTNSEHKQLQTLQAELLTSDRTIKQLRKELSSLQNERNTLLTECQKQSEAIAKRKEQTTAVERERNKALSNCVDLRKTVAKLEKALIAAENERAKLLDNCEKQKKTIAKLLAELQLLSQKTHTSTASSSPFPLKPYRQHQVFASTEKRSLIMHEQNDRNVVTLVLNGKHTLLDMEKWSNIISVATNSEYGVGLKADGTILTIGNEPYSARFFFPFWTDIVAISTNGPHTAGLKSDGRVVAAGATDCGQCNVSHWRNILSIAATAACTYGLQADGTVITTGNAAEVSHWRNIVALAAGPSHLIGLRADGTVVATGSNSNGQCNVEQWNNIIAIATGVYTIGLKADGTVVFAGDHDELRNILATRKNITDIFASGKVFFTYDSSTSTNPGQDIRRAYIKSWIDLADNDYIMDVPKRIPCEKS